MATKNLHVWKIHSQNIYFSEIKHDRAIKMVKEHVYMEHNFVTEDPTMTVII